MKGLNISIFVAVLIFSVPVAAQSPSSFEPLFTYPVNFNTSLTLPFEINNNGFFNAFIINGSVATDTALPAQSTNSKSLLNHPSQTRTSITPMPLSTPTSTPTPLPDSSSPTLIPSPTPVPSISAIPYDTTGEGDRDRSAMTQTQRDEAIKIACTSPICPEYNLHPDDTWGCMWTAPYDGHTIIVGKQMSDDTVFQIYVDLNTQKVFQSYRMPSVSEVTHSKMY